MSSARPPAQHLLLAGGGHTHALLLLRWLMDGARPTGAITLVNRTSTALYSGMVPGLVAGVYRRQECSINLRQLCSAVGVTLVIAEITGLDLAGQQLLLANRPSLHWDWLSLDLGASTRSLSGCAIGVKPLEPFLHWLHHRQPSAQPLRIRGGGAAAVELALALRGRGQAVELLLRGDDLHLQPSRAQALAARLLAQAGVTLRRRVADDQPAELACTGSRAPAWLAEAGLPCDGDGRVRTGASLQVEGQPRVFAVGDCGVLNAAPRPPSGVWAVRAAPTLAANLGRCLARPPPGSNACSPAVLGGPSAVPCSCWPIPQSQRRTPRAIALWGPLALGPSRLLWRLETAHRPPASWPASAAGGCDGWARRAQRWPAAAAPPSSPQPPWRPACSQAGLGGPAEDAAVVARLEHGELLLQSVDGFPALVDDPWLNGRLTTLHACSDLWASGARVHSAQALVTLPETAPGLQQQQLAQTLAGIRSVLEPQGACLIGGHSLEGRDGAGLAVSLCVNGTVAAAQHWPKGPLQPGQALILTRPLGTGVLFAAAMAGAAQAGWIDRALEQMQQSQAALVPLLRHLGCRVCTDITGFGLLGHLGEMIAGGAPGLHGASWMARPRQPCPVPWSCSSRATPAAWPPATHGPWPCWRGRCGSAAARTAALEGLLIDPQTCGPLLAAVPAEAAAACLEQLAQHGFPQARQLGRVLDPEPGLG
jgi:selenide, water dikinase